MAKSATVRPSPATQPRLPFLHRDEACTELWGVDSIFPSRAWASLSVLMVSKLESWFCSGYCLVLETRVVSRDSRMEKFSLLWGGHAHGLFHARPLGAGTDREERYERVVVASLRALAEALRVGEAKVAESQPWSVAKWAVARRLDNPRATVLLLSFA